MSQAGIQWMEVLPHHEELIQHGEIICNVEQLAATSGYTDTVFNQPFETEPEVVVWISGLRLAKKDIVNISVSVSRISRLSFSVKVTPHSDYYIDEALMDLKITWVAYKKGMSGISSGRVSSEDIRPASEPQLHDRGWAEFSKEASFTRAPRVMVGLNGFSFKAQDDVRVGVEAANINTHGFLWKADSWSTSVMYSVGVSYIAME